MRSRAEQVSLMGLACACLLGHGQCQGVCLVLKHYSSVNILTPFQVSLFYCFDYKSDTCYKTSFCDLEQYSPLSCTSQSSRPTFRVSDSVALGGAWEFAFLAYSQVMLMLLIQGPQCMQRDCLEWAREALVRVPRNRKSGWVRLEQLHLLCNIVALDLVLEPELHWVANFAAGSFTHQIFIDICDVPDTIPMSII